MDVTCTTELPEETSSEMLVAGVVEEGFASDSPLARLDRALDGQIQEIMEEGDFKGAFGETALLYPRGKLPSRRLLLAGLGPRARLDLDRVREAAAVAAKKVRDLHVSTFSFALRVESIPVEEVAQAIVEGALLGLYVYQGEKTAPTLNSDEPTSIKAMTLVGIDNADLEAAERGAGTGRVIGEAVCLARDLVNHPANLLTPRALAAVAARVAEEGGFACRVLDEAEADELGMGAFLAVARGSAEPPKFIVLEYGPGEAQDTLVLVGKGVTFDSGGISLKPKTGLEMMKFDMGGAAAVLGAIQVVAALGLPVHLVCLIPSVENLPGEGAYRPGDVLRSLSGQTIEVIDTDCEGRLALADALTYGQRFSPSAMVDVATLTYACIAAFGHMVTGLMTNDEELGGRLKRAGRTTAELVWELPIVNDYFRQIKSQVADYKNRGGDPAGAITAAMLLSKFTGGTPWAHLDIAGTAWVESTYLYPERTYLPKTGGTGIGVRLLVQFVRDWVAEREADHVVPGH